MRFKEYRLKKLQDEKYRKAYLDIKKGEDVQYRMGELITEARHYRLLTQEQLAKKLGTTQSAVARVENGGVIPNVNFLFRVAKAIGTYLVIEWGFTREIEIRHNTERNYCDVLSGYDQFEFSSKTQNTELVVC